YRSFSSAGSAGFHFEKAGPAVRGDPRQRIWSAMSWKFQVTEYLPRAVKEPYFIPLARPLGHDDDPQIVPALYCRLKRGKATRDFWLGRSDHATTTISLEGEAF